MKRKSLLLLLLFAGAYISTRAQENKRYPLTADSLTGGNYKDIFKSFFQLAFNQFTSDNKEIEFTSNPFAIMAKADPRLLVDTSYVRYKALRNLNFAFAAKLDSSYKFNGFSSGITYAIINRRDEKVSHYFLAQAFNANQEANKIFPQLTAFVTTIGDSARRNEINDQINGFFNGDKHFNELDTALQARIKKAAADTQANYLLELLKKDPKLNLGELVRANYDSVKTNFQNRLLWTVGISDTTYRDRFMFSNVVLFSNLVKGISQPNRILGLELNVSAAYQQLDDSLHAGRDLKRKAFSFEPGLNLVIRAKRSHYPWAELKLSGAYTNLNRPYASERRDSLTINGTLRIRIMDDIWIPLEIKYDPETGNVFGFLNVRVNFTALGKRAKEDDTN